MSDNLSVAVEAAAEALHAIRLDEAWVDCQDPRVPDHGGNQCGAGAHVLDPRDVARIAVEAAAPHLHRDNMMLAMEQRAERAEAEVERLAAICHQQLLVIGEEIRRAERAEATVDALDRDVASYISDLVDERALANRLASALFITRLEDGVTDEQRDTALAAYEEARRG
jgi:hypothetical protein